MTVKHKNAAECERAFKDQVSATLDTSAKWLGVIFYEGTDGKLHLERTTCNFDLGKIVDVHYLLDQNIAGEFSGLDHTPLPVAPEFGTPVFAGEKGGTT